jgi:hypothetical protein
VVEIGEESPSMVGAGNNIRRMDFTGDHYRPYSWWQLQYP